MANDLNGQDVRWQFRRGAYGNTSSDKHDVVAVGEHLRAGGGLYRLTAASAGAPRAHLIGCMPMTSNH